MLVFIEESDLVVKYHNIKAIRPILNTDSGADEALKQGCKAIIKMENGESYFINKEVVDVFKDIQTQVAKSIINASVEKALTQ